MERSSPGGFWDLGIGATVGGFEDVVRGRFLGVMLVFWGTVGELGWWWN